MPDVVVVGGGIAGVGVANALTPRASVTLVEQESSLAYHTSGRSAAIFVESFGSNPVWQLARASKQFFETPPPDLVDVPLLVPRGALAIGREDQLDALQTLSTRAETNGAPVSWLSPSESAELCPALDTAYVAAALFDDSASDIDVAATHQAFVRGFRRDEGTILTDTPVTGLEKLSGGWRVHLGEDTLDTDIVVNASGAWGDEVAAMAGIGPLGLMPLRRTAFTVPGSPHAAAWPLVVDAVEDFYFKPDGPQLLCSLAEENPSVPCDAKPREEDVALAIERINAATSLGIRSVHSAWTGLRTFSPDRRQVAGFDPDVEGFFWLVGQGGSGFETAPALSAVAAALILGAEVPARLSDLGFDATSISPKRFRS